MNKFMKSLVIISLVLTFALPAMAADKVLNVKIQSMTEAVDRNGHDYVRFIVGETRTLQGVSYDAGVPVMAFGPNVEQAKTLKEGDTLKAIVTPREFQGRQSYTIQKFMPTNQ